MAKFTDITGQRFGRLITIRRDKNNSWDAIQYLCRCDCGNELIVLAGHLKTGNTKSCGCLKRDVIRRPKTHGQSRSPLHRIWLTMRQRCQNPRNKKYTQYGGRGIRICKRWEKFQNFLEDMGKRPFGKMIERVDNNGNYDPGNCRWATAKEQANNTRRNRWISYGGMTLTLTDWAAHIGITPGSLHERLQKLPISEALTKEKRRWT